jgi:hypothetical protein
MLMSFGRVAFPQSQTPIAERKIGLCYFCLRDDSHGVGGVILMQAVGIEGTGKWNGHLDRKRALRWHYYGIRPFLQADRYIVSHRPGI